MTIRRSLLPACALALALTLPAAASAAPTAVDVRIEGKTSTLFDAPVTTDGKTITTQTGGSHLCDGSTATPPVGPGPTPNSALDDAAIKGGFTWDGAWFGTDFFASQIAGESETASEFWGVYVNGAMLNVGGCQHIIKAGDEVLWTFDAFNKVGGLKLAAPGGTRPGVPIVARATDIASGAGVAGVTVGSSATDGNGNATLSFAKPGVYTLKADKNDRVRSRAVRICVDPPGAEECTFGDKTAPAIRLDAPKLASDFARLGNRIPLSWQGDDTGGSGVKRYRIEVRRAGKPDSAWRLLRTDTAKTSGRLNGSDGVAYDLRVRAYDRANNASIAATATTIVPIDNLSDRPRFSKRGWKVLSRQGAWQLSTSRANRAGATASLGFTGSGATIVTRELPNGGRVRITVDGGDAKVVSLQGKSRFRRKLVGTGKLGPGRHTLRVTSLDRAPVEIDAIAIRP
jgi:hypothetical protein